MPTSIKTSLAPVAGSQAKILILGSMPGEISLANQEYYAHPRNLFWSMITRLFNVAENLSYPDKLALLKRQQIALWDVLKRCERTGSLDADIKPASEQANDIGRFLAEYHHISKICFNGTKAYSAFNKHLLKPNPAQYQSLTLLRLPSTSPANVSMSLSAKMTAWHQALRLPK